MIRANAERSQGLRRKHFNIALGSLCECVACLDAADCKEVLLPGQREEGRTLLWRTRGMLIGLNRCENAIVREEGTAYGSPRFPHDDLDVYKLGIELIRWVHGVQTGRHLPTRQRNRLDTTSTGILLNVAEGAGKSGARDKRKFVDIAHSHALQAALTLDLLVAADRLEERHAVKGKQSLDRIAAMLGAWRNSLREE